MGGVVGVVEYEGEAEVVRPYWPLLRLGEWVHVGKGAVMGMGRYRVEACSRLGKSPCGEETTSSPNCPAQSRE